ncbi:MAG: transglutaminase domain-containing protein [Limnobacter sp.]|nr:transglutaminase domain-containing protein [Limnobacter sp.]
MRSDSLIFGVAVGLALVSLAACAPLPEQKAQVFKPKAAPSPVPAVPDAAAPPVATGFWAELDNHALQAPKSVERDADQLLAYLIKPAKTDEQKARVIYRWLTSRFTYDVASFQARNYKRQTLDQLLVSRRGVCDGYAVAFQELGKKAGLTVKLIEGRAKGGSNGEQFTADQANHAWNMVLINGQWKIVDATWGAGHVDDKNGYQAKLDDFYFMTPVENLLLSHYDFSDPLGVFSARQIGLKEFESFPFSGTRAVAVGFDVNRVLNHYRQTLLQPVVDTFNQPYGSFQVAQAPVAKQLKAGQPYEFQLKTDSFGQLIAFQSQSQNNSTEFVRKGGYYVATIRPAPGDLMVMGSTGNAGEYEALLKYEVR